MRKHLAVLYCMRRLVIITIGITLLLLLSIKPSETQLSGTSIDTINGLSDVSAGGYCATPPFIGAAVPPNVLFVNDVSGSMSWAAYYNYSTGNPAYSSTTTYEGYFDPTKVYKQVSGIWTETTDPESCTGPTWNSWWGYTISGTCSGNKLNYTLMERIDLVRWAVTGGNPASCTGSHTFNGNYCDPELWNQPGNSTKVGSVCNDTIGGCTLLTNGGDQVTVPWSRVNAGLTFKFENLTTKPRMGAMFFSTDTVLSNKVYVGDFTSANSTNDQFPYINLITAINSTAPTGDTPTAPAMWDALNYLSQNNPQYGGFTPQQGTGDYWRNPMYVCKQGGTNCKFVPCAKNFVILMTDGQWNSGGGPPASAPSCSIDPVTNSADPVVPAYKMHMGFTNAPANRKTSVNAVYGIGLFLGGTGQQSLENIAMYGSFDNGAKTWPDSLSGYPQGTCQMDDCGAGKGSACTALPASSPDWDADGNGVPDTFYKASDATQIKQAILDAIMDILRRASSGTGVSTLSTQTRTSSTILQAYFLPEDIEKDRKLYWRGYLRNLWVDSKLNIREDNGTGSFGILDMKGDNILSFSFDTTSQALKAYQYTDSNGDGIPDSCTSTTYESNDQVTPIHDPADNNVWEAGNRLWNRVPSTRKIYYYNNTTSIFTDFNTSSDADINKYWNLSNMATADTIINYIRGTDASGLRNRTPYGSTNTWKLGDTVHSTPRVVSNTGADVYQLTYGDTTYANFMSQNIASRKSVIFTGANDGLLHAFNFGTLSDVNDPNNPSYKAKLTSPYASATPPEYLGDELWAFIPRNAIPYLYWYAQQGYCHIYYVDQRSYIVDASIGNPKTDTMTTPKTKDSWRTILIGSMGFGGEKLTVNGTTYSSSIFALDITDPTNPTLLWEKTLPDNTLTTSYPTVIRFGPSDEYSNKKFTSYEGDWYVVVGSGPLEPYGSAAASFAANPSLYFINLRTGSIDKQITLSAPNQAIGDIIAVDVDKDYSVDAIYFGTYGYNGSTGALYRMTFRNSSGSYISIASSTSSQVSQVIAPGLPFYSAPEVAIDENNNMWLYTGTGRYLNQADASDLSVERLYGIKETCWNGSCNTTYSSFYDSSGMIVKAAVKDVTCMCNGVDVGAPVLKGTGYSCDTADGGPGGDLIVKTTTGETVYKCDGTTPADGGGTLKGLATYISTNPSPVYNGWMVNLETYSGCTGTAAGERDLSSPFIARGITDFVTFLPSTDSCSFGGNSNLYGLYYLTGTPYKSPVFLSTLGTSGTITQGGTVGIAGQISMGIGVPPMGEAFAVLPASATSYAAFLSNSTGGIVKQTLGGGKTLNIIIHWLER